MNFKFKLEYIYFLNNKLEIKNINIFILRPINNIIIIFNKLNLLFTYFFI